MTIRVDTHTKKTEHEPARRTPNVNDGCCSTVRTGSSGLSSGRVESEDEGRAARLEEGRRETRPTDGDDWAGGAEGARVAGQGDEYSAWRWIAGPTNNDSANHSQRNGSANHNQRNGSANHNQRRGSAGGGGGSGRDDMEVWDFERLASTPLLAAAFEEFSQKALCHESVLFLSEVSRYYRRRRGWDGGK